jgi:ABC-type nitrate/sulfonate/bicarbonate transport system permease component
MSGRDFYNYQTRRTNGIKHKASFPFITFNAFYPFLNAFIVILVVWIILNKYGFIIHRNVSIFIPSPIIIGSTIWEMILDGELEFHIINSLIRVSLGSLIGTILGISLGLLMGLSIKFDGILDPLVQTIRPIAPVAWIPLAIVLLGIGLKMTVFLCSISCFFTVILATASGIRNVDENLIKCAKVFAGSKSRTILEVVLPSAIPQIVTGIRIGIGRSFMTLVAAEMIGAHSGLGFIIRYGREVFRPELIITGMITIGTIGYFIDLLIQRIENHTQKYKS